MSASSPEILEGRAVIGGFGTRVLEVVGSGPTVLLLHGFSDSAESWRWVMEILARFGRRTIAVDLPGFGQADLPGAGSLLDAIDAFVTAAVERFTTDGLAPIVVGNSLGGAAALRAAQNAEVVIAGSIAISPPGYQHPHLLNMFLRLRALEPVLYRPVVPMRMYRFLAAGAFQWLASSPDRPVRHGYAEAWALQFRTHRDVRRLLGCIPQLRIELLGGLAAQQSRLNAPTLVLWGSRDRICLVAGSRKLRQAHPTARLETMDGLGHCPHLQDPGLIAASIHAFVTALEADSADDATASAR